MVAPTPIGDVKVKRLGNQLLINLPKEVARALGLKPGTMTIVSSSSRELVLEKGEGIVKVVDVGRGRLRLYISIDKAPFAEGDRVIVFAENNKLVIKHAPYFIVKPSTSQGNFRVNIPWELVVKTGLNQYRLLKIYGDDRRVVIEPLEKPD